MINASLSEFLLWCVVKGSVYENFFTPCVAISSDARSVIMRKIIMVTNSKKYLETYCKIRKFCHEIGYFETNSDERNFGLFENNLVLCDYSIQLKFNQQFFNIFESIIKNQGNP